MEDDGLHHDGNDTMAEVTMGRIDYAHALRPVTLHQIRNATRVHSEAPFTIDGKEVQRIVTVVTLLEEGVVPGKTTARYEIDDGTTDPFVIWRMQAEPGEHILENGEACYVRIVGRVTRLAGAQRPSINVICIHKVQDANEVLKHYLEAMVATLSYERGPPPVEVRRTARMPEAEPLQEPAESARPTKQPQARTPQPPGHAVDSATYRPQSRTPQPPATQGRTAPSSSGTPSDETGAIPSSAESDFPQELTQSDQADPSASTSRTEDTSSRHRTRNKRAAKASSSHARDPAIPHIKDENTPQRDNGEETRTQQVNSPTSTPVPETPARQASSSGTPAASASSSRPRRALPPPLYTESSDTEAQPSSSSKPIQSRPPPPSPKFAPSPNPGSSRHAPPPSPKFAPSPPTAQQPAAAPLEPPEPDPESVQSPPATSEPRPAKQKKARRRISRRDPLSHLSNLQRQIMLKIMNGEVSGVHVMVIAQSLTTMEGITPEQVADDLDWLVEQGMIEAVDEDNLYYRVAERVYNFTL